MMPKIHPKYTNKKEHGKIKQPAVSRHPRNTTQQPSRSHHVVHNEIVSEHLPKCIPTIVNGQINPTKKESNNNSANNFWDKIHNLVRESTVKAHNDKAKYSKCSKHKILIVGDSHLIGCAAKLIASLDT